MNEESKSYFLPLVFIPIAQTAIYQYFTKQKKEEVPQPLLLPILRPLWPAAFPKAAQPILPHKILAEKVR